MSDKQELSSAKIEQGWRDTFSTENPFCPCNLKSFTKAVRWAGRGSNQPVTFPYTPRRVYVDVDGEGMPLNGWNREGICPEWLAGAGTRGEQT